ncbi:MAG: hypothetical protein Q4B26_17020, partial [Eubacteriales bacterium]|nr:hypothetical protein [Eubacteriales bacterium]
MAGLPRRKTRSYSFVIRLLLSTLLAALIPLMITSTRQFNEQVDSFNESLEMQLQENATAIARRLDSCVKSMNSVSVRFMMDPSFTSSVLDGKVSSQLEAFQSIDDYLLLLPFVMDYGIYDSELGQAFTTTGMYSANGIAREFFGVEESVFQEYLAFNSRTSGFIAQTGATGKFVYICPLRSSN